MFSVNFNRKTRVSPVKSAEKLNTTRSSNLLHNDKTRLYNLPKIPSYYKIDRPSLSPQIKRNIEEKLSLDKKAQISFKKRQKNKDYFVNFKKNPFSNQTNNFEALKQNKERKIMTNKSQSIFRPNKDKVSENIVEAINSFREKSPILRDQSLKNMKKQASKLSKEMNEQISQMRYIFKPKKNTGNDTVSYSKRQEMDFDEIIKIQEENYYLQHQKSINIFACIKNPPKILNKAILSKHAFNFTSMVQKAQEKVRLPIYRDISRKARLTSLKNKFTKVQLMEFIASSDINSNTKKIRFEDMLGIATGRCSSQLVNDWIQNKDKSFKYENLGKHQVIILKENTYNINTNNQQAQQNFIEAEQWKNSRSPQQINYTEKCKAFKGHILYKMDQKVKITTKTIGDPQAHKVLTEQIKRDILYFLNMNAGANTSNKPKKLVEPNAKLTATKARAVKNNELIQTMKLIKNKFDTMQQLGNKTARI